MKIYHNPRCSKSRETLAIIEQNNHRAEIIDYLINVPSEEDLKRIIYLLNIKPIDLIRKGEELYKTEFKGKTLSDSEWIKAMIKYPKLMERPIVINGNKAIIGRPPENVMTLF